MDLAGIKFKVSSLITDDDTSIASDLIVFIFIGGVAMFLLLVLLVLACLFKDKFKPKLRKVKQKFMWNASIRSIDVAYLKVLFSACF